MIREHGARFVAVALMVGGLAACTGNVSDANGGDASAGDSEPQDQASSTPQEGGTDTAVGEGSTGGGEAGASTDGDAPGCTPSPPSTIPSMQTITIRIANTGAAPVWVVTDGGLCSPLGIERLSPSAEPVYLTGHSLDPDCCEPVSGTCDEISGRGAAAYGRLLPGETMDMPWDARSVVTDACMVSCGNYSRPMYIAFQPVTAGKFKVSVGYTDALEPDCKPDQVTGTTASCYLGFANPAAQEEQCWSTYNTSVEFELQEGVDLVVPVAIP